MALTLLALTAIPTVVLFLSYVDLLPTGLWRYQNIHYFKWTLPGFALFAYVALRELAIGDRRGRAAGCFAAALVPLSLHLTPVRATAAQPARMVQLPGEITGFDQSYFSQMTIRDRHGIGRNIIDFRLMPDDQGLRLLALGLPFPDGPTILSGDPRRHPGGAAPVRWRSRLALGWPCWLPPLRVRPSADPVHAMRVSRRIDPPTTDFQRPKTLEINVLKNWILKASP